MKKQELKEYIGNHRHDMIYFSYNGKDGTIDPFGPIIPFGANEAGNKYKLNFNGNETTVYSLDDVMSTPFIDGKSLNDVAENIEL